MNTIKSRPAKPPKHVAAFHRQEWLPFHSLPPELQAVKDALIAKGAVS